MGVLKYSPVPGYLTCIKPYNHIILSKLKHISTLPSYLAIINGILPKFTFLIETTNPDKMEIKDELVLNSMTWVAADNIEYNTTPGYYIFR